MGETCRGEVQGAGKLRWLILAGFVLGLAAGMVVYATMPDARWLGWFTEYFTQPVGDIFLRLLFMLVIPLLVSALIIGVAEMREISALKKVGTQTLIYTVIVSTISVAISLAVVNYFQPGAGIDPATAQALTAQQGDKTSSIIDQSVEAKSGVDAIVGIIPSNFITAMSENDILAVMFFALFFGIGMLLTPEDKTAGLKSVFDGVFRVSMRLIGLVIWLAPVAVFCFMFNLASQFGWDLIVRLSAFVGVVLLALGIQMFGVFPVILKFIARKSPVAFFRETQEAFVMAFSTASSNATLPTSLRIAEDRLHLPPRISRFVLTIGATANQNGTAMFEGVTVLFLAQFFGVELTLSQQVFVMLICILGGIGTAGVPAGSLPVIALILGSIGVPPEGIGLILGVDRFLDMCRTTLNVMGDLVAAQVISSRNADLQAKVP